VSAVHARLSSRVNAKSFPSEVPVSHGPFFRRDMLGKMRLGGKFEVPGKGFPAGARLEGLRNRSGEWS